MSAREIVIPLSNTYAVVLTPTAFPRGAMGLKMALRHKDEAGAERYRGGFAVRTEKLLELVEAIDAARRLFADGSWPPEGATP